MVNETHVDEWGGMREYVIELSIDASISEMVHPDDVPDSADGAVSEWLEQRFYDRTEYITRLSKRIADGGVSYGQVTITSVHEDPYDVRRRKGEQLLDHLAESGGEMEWGGDFREFCDEHNVNISSELPDILAKLWRSGDIEMVSGGTVRLTDES
jgi:hypothetical protein